VLAPVLAPVSDSAQAAEPVWVAALATAQERATEPASEPAAPVTAAA